MADSEGWVQAKSKSRRLKPRDRPPPPPSLSARSVPLLSKEDITKEFLSIRSQFEASPCCDALRDIVSAFVSDNFKDGQSPITKAICLGIGSFDPPDGSWQLKRRAHTQLAALLIMVEELGTTFFPSLLFEIKINTSPLLTLYHTLTNSETNIQRSKHPMDLSNASSKSPPSPRATSPFSLPWAILLSILRLAAMESTPRRSSLARTCTETSMPCHSRESCRQYGSAQAGIFGRRMFSFLLLLLLLMHVPFPPTFYHVFSSLPFVSWRCQ